MKLTPEQEMLRSSIRSIGQRCGISPGSGAKAEVRPKDAIELLAPLGLEDILEAPIEGPWSGCVEAAVVAMELARWVVPAPFLGTTVMAAPLLQATGQCPEGTAVLVDRTLSTPVLDAEATSAVAWDAAGATSAIGLVEQPGSTGDCYSVVRAEIEEERDVAKPLDLSRRAYGCDLVSATEVAKLDGADGFVERWTALSTTCIAADLVGLMEGSLAIAQSYARSRCQFGRQIGSFQAVQHLLAEQHLALQAARIATYFAAWSAQESSASEALQAARVAKAYASEAGVRAVEAVIQVHGGIGFTWEHAAHLFLRRAVYDRAVLGDERRHYRAYFAGLRSELAEAEVADAR